MNDQTLIDALDQSIQWLAEGRTVADCVRAYPDLAEPLTALLTTGIVVKRIQVRQSEISAAQDRVRLRLQARRQRWTQTRLLLRGVAAVLIVSLGVFLFGQAPSIATLLNQFQATTTPTLTLTTTTIPTMMSQTASASMTLTQTAMPSATLTASVTATPTLTNTPELQPPIIQVTRYTTPTVIRATLPRTVPPTARPPQGTATPPAATDDHGGEGSGSGTDDHGGSGSGTDDHGGGGNSSKG